MLSCRKICNLFKEINWTKQKEQKDDNKKKKTEGGEKIKQKLMSGSLCQAYLLFSLVCSSSS